MLYMLNSRAKFRQTTSSGDAGSFHPPSAAVFNDSQAALHGGDSRGRMNTSTNGIRVTHDTIVMAPVGFPHSSLLQQSSLTFCSLQMHNKRRDSEDLESGSYVEDSKATLPDTDYSRTIPVRTEQPFH